MPSTGYKRDSLKRGDSSRELKGVSNKELNFISYAAGEPLKILRQGTLVSFASQEDLSDCRGGRKR